MTGKSTSTLFDFSPPSEDDCAVAAMKWMIAVMDRDDKSLCFVSGVLSSCCKYGGLTERQADAVDRIYYRILNAFEAGALEIQGGHISIDGPTNVIHLRPRGAA